MAAQAQQNWPLESKNENGDNGMGDNDEQQPREDDGMSNTQPVFSQQWERPTEPEQNDTAEKQNDFEPADEDTEINIAEDALTDRIPSQEDMDRVQDTLVPRKPSYASGKSFVASDAVHNETFYTKHGALSLDIIMRPLRRNGCYFMHRRTFDINSKLSAERGKPYQEFLKENGVHIVEYVEDLYSYMLVERKEQNKN